MAHSPPYDTKQRTRRFDSLVAGALVVLAGYLLFRGYGFYALDLDARLDHTDYEVLRPSGTVGHGYGIVGTLLILSNLLYLARRRFARANLGSMRAWLDLHVAGGLAGSALVLFHSAFQFRTGVALMTGVALGLVVVTGLVGRYLYALSPVADMERLDRLLVEFDATQPGVARGVRTVLDAHRPAIVDHHASLLRKLSKAPGWLRVARERRRGVARVLDEARAACGPREAEVFVAFRGVASDIAAQDALAEGFTSLLQSWRALHRLLAILLLLLVPVHVGVAWFYGYRWIFG
ncbi:MAG: hypothetical protein KC668_19245 [Myxococcales bacterium]|nr:hypothetical protein [Myxococcales bacterium]